jgi:hypothetical protein
MAVWCGFHGLWRGCTDIYLIIFLLTVIHKVSFFFLPIVGNSCNFPFFFLPGWEIQQSTSDDRMTLYYLFRFCVSQTIPDKLYKLRWHISLMSLKNILKCIMKWYWKLQWKLKSKKQWSPFPLTSQGAIFTRWGPRIVFLWRTLSSQ